MNLGDIRRDKTLGHVLTLMVFLVFMAVVSFVVGWMPSVFRDHSDLAWWRRDANQWIYPLQSVLCLVLLVFWWKHYDFNWSLKSILIGIVMGAVGIGFWLLPTQIYEWFSFGNEEEVPWWMKRLGVAERRDGFDARMFGADALAFDCAADWTSLTLRLFRAVVIVSLVEEIFWRGFLMRWLLKPDGAFWGIPFGKPSWLTYGVVTGAFMIAHAPVDYAGAFAFGTIIYLLTIWTKSLGACVVAHAVANALMGWYAVETGKLGLW